MTTIFKTGDRVVLTPEWAHATGNKNYQSNQGVVTVVQEFHTTDRHLEYVEVQWEGDGSTLMPKVCRHDRVILIASGTPVLVAVASKTQLQHLRTMTAKNIPLPVHPTDIEAAHKRGYALAMDDMYRALAATFGDAFTTLGAGD